MPLTHIYVTRHGHRLNWTIDLNTGTYHSVYPTPTGIPVDPPLTGPGVRQSHELAAHINSDEFSPKPCRIYCSPFYRCLQTIQPTVEALRARQEVERKGDVDLDVRLENGLGEWFGSSSTFTHPSPPTPSTLQPLFPTLLPAPAPTPSSTPNNHTPHLRPSPNGENIATLHNRLATTLHLLIAQVDAELAIYERNHPSEANQSRAILICSHAAPIIAMGRALTGRMPGDTAVEDFRPFTASLATFVRRGGDEDGVEVEVEMGMETEEREVIDGKDVPRWKGGVGVGGGWECVGNGECGFLSGGEERGWHFNGEEDFDTTPVALAGPSGARTDEIAASVAKL